jgi:hypothetical protein
VAFNVSVLGIVIIAPITYVAIKLGGLTLVASGVLLSTLILTVIIFETSVRRAFGVGFLHYFSYLSLNIFSLYAILFFLLNNYSDPSTRLLAFIVSVFFSIITLPINNVVDRAKALLAK